MDNLAQFLRESWSPVDGQRNRLLEATITAIRATPSPPKPGLVPCR
ncbi:hypothetical protein [Micromonospora sp. HM5-17]|jgi:hypothetical protein|nr:hypothetical protein [Micromonospora sp. HM5-17]